MRYGRSVWQQYRGSRGEATWRIIKFASITVLCLQSPNTPSQKKKASLQVCTYSLWKVGVWGLHRGLEEVAEIPSPKVAVGVQVQLQCRWRYWNSGAEASEVGVSACNVNARAPPCGYSCALCTGWALSPGLQWPDQWRKYWQWTRAASFDAPRQLHNYSAICFTSTALQIFKYRQCGDWKKLLWTQQLIRKTNAYFLKHKKSWRLYC